MTTEMTTDSRLSKFEEFRNTFDSITRKPEKFLSIQNDIIGDIKCFIKKLYDFTKEEDDVETSTSLPELIIEDFDDEQIWQELELQNEELHSRFVRDVAHLVAAKDKLTFPIDQFEKGTDEEDGSEVSDVESEEISDDENTSAEQHAEELNDTENRKIKNKGKKSSVVDDQFFKLHELETFLNKEDKKAIKDTNDDESDDDDDESVDLFNGDKSESDSERDIHYADFFDQPEENTNDGDDISNKDRSKYADSSKNTDITSGEEEIRAIDNKHVRFNLEGSSSEEESENEEKDSGYGKQAKSKSTEQKSSFETRQERIKSTIEKLEEKALSEKPWQMKGEATATSRPQNSLLEEALEFDVAVRPAPVITEETTLKLEDIIRQRIRDKAWDDVERKAKPVDTPYEYKKKLVLDQEKSKLSLAEIYEQEYLKQREAANPATEEKPEEVPKEHEEINKMMTDLFTKLDALSNFHYIPKPVAPEVKIISNLPAITVEEVAPVTVSDAALLAPEEIHEKPKGEIVGKNERTSTDKKRERRRKKKMQRERQKEKEKKEKLLSKLKPGLGNKYSKEKAVQMLEKASKESNVSIIDGKNKQIRSSKMFFTQLQEEVESHIKSKTQNTKKRKQDSKTVSAKKLKF